MQIVRKGGPPEGINSQLWVQSKEDRATRLMPDATNPAMKRSWFSYCLVLSGARFNQVL